MSKPKISIWGIGNHVKDNVLNVLRDLNCLDFHGFWTRNTKTRNEIDSSSKHVYQSRQEMLDDTELDIIYVSTPTGLHFEHGKEVLQAEKHLWMEKSFTDSLSKTKELLDLASKRQKQVKECFMFRHHPHYEKVSSLIRNNALGRIDSIHSSFGFPHLDDSNFRYQPELGGGSLLDAGAYPIHFLLSAGYDIIPSNLTGFHANLYSEDKKIDTRGIFSGSTTNNTDFCLEWGFGRTYRNHVTIWGSEKILQTDKFFSKKENYEPVIHLCDSQQNETVLEINSANHFRVMFQKFTQELKNQNLQKDFQLILQQAQTLQRIFSEGNL